MTSRTGAGDLASTNHDRRLASEQLLATALRRKVNLSQRTWATKEGPSAARYEGTSTDRYQGTSTDRYQGTSAARYELKTASFAPRRNNYQPPSTKEGPSAPRYTLWITIKDHENGIRLNGTDRQTVRLQPLREHFRSVQRKRLHGETETERELFYGPYCSRVPCNWADGRTIYR